MLQRSHLIVCRAKTKNPAGARFFQRCAVGSRRTHCVMSTKKVYAFYEEHAISARILMFLSMEHE
ncbi:hypothetical protein EGX89_13655 [Citrobacter freundii]|nr:hypothetical protein EGX89_13655 [Citrobacter freundii]HAU5686970.1 hypothetical protein [Citrobacter freundii]